MKEEIIIVSPETVIGETAKIKIDGFRFVTLSCVETDEKTFDILYHFDKDLKMKHFRLTAAKDMPVPSISKVYLAAFLVENEIQDLFGIRFDGLAIDYKRTLYLDGETVSAPFCRYTVNRVGKKDTPAPEISA